MTAAGTAFVTGASGFIGRGVIRALARRQYRVRGLVRSEHRAELVRDLGAEPVIGDIGDVERLKEEARSADVVVHNAFIRGDAYDTTPAAEADMQAVSTMLDAMGDRRSPFVYTSGCAVFGSQSEPVTETTPLNTPDYIAWRPAIEKMVMGSNYGIVIRPNLVYGEGDSFPLTSLIQLAKQHGASRYIDGGETTLSAVHIDDLAEAYALAIEKAPPGSLFN